MRDDIPRGLCQCGCGRPTNLATKTAPQHGWIKGEPVRFIRGHSKRKYEHGATCDVTGCARSVEAQGLCHSHFEWRRRHGVAPTHVILDNDPDRFHAKITVVAAGHWIWRGARASAGLYGAASLDGRVQPAHRVAWQLHRGPIPDGYEIDHLCRKTLCCNPEHLEPVPPRINSLRSESPAAHNAAKTHCKRGHEFTPDNIRWVGPDKRNRACCTCARERPREAPEVRAARHAARADEINAKRRARRAAS